MRTFVILILALISILEVGPIPITPILLIYIVLYRPLWFYDWVLKLYDKN